MTYGPNNITLLRDREVTNWANWRTEMYTNDRDSVQRIKRVLLYYY